MPLSSEELDSAWLVAAKDVKERAFGCHPFELILCERSRGKVIEECSNDKWQPGEIVTIDQPKGKGLLRPGASLRFRDHLAYTAYVARTIPFLQKRIEVLSAQVDYAYVLKRGAEAGGNWFDSWFEYYKRFTRDSIDKLSSSKFVALMDIAGYYEMIDHRRLLSELAGGGVEADTRHAIGRMLGRWARISHRGIPQGFSASDVLGKWYLVSCDEMLINKGHRHMRWVDDFRFFGDSAEAVTLAAQDAARILRRLGLVLQSAKFRVMTAAAARQDFERIQSVIEPVRKRWMESAQAALKGADITDSMPDFVIEQALAAQEKVGVVEEPREVLVSAYESHCSGRPDCDKTILKFLLRKLGKAGVDRFIPDVVDKLRERPEESQSLLSYLGSFPISEDVHKSIVDVMRQNQNVASYQVYEILRWYVRSKVDVHASVVEFARLVQANNNLPPYLQVAARVVLALYGNNGDLEDMHARYGYAGSDLDRATIICCLESRELSIRNAFLSYASSDGVFCDVAVKGVQGVGLLRQAWSFLVSRA